MTRLGVPPKNPHDSTHLERPRPEERLNPYFANQPLARRQLDPVRSTARSFRRAQACPGADIRLASSVLIPLRSPTEAPVKEFESYATPPAVGQLQNDDSGRC